MGNGEWESLWSIEVKAETRIAISKDCKGLVEVWILRNGARIWATYNGEMRTVSENSNGSSQSTQIPSDSCDCLEADSFVEMTVEQFVLFAMAGMLYKEQRS